MDSQRQSAVTQACNMPILHADIWDEVASENTDEASLCKPANLLTDPLHTFRTYVTKPDYSSSFPARRLCAEDGAAAGNIPP